MTKRKPKASPDEITHIVSLPQNSVFRLVSHASRDGRHILGTSGMSFGAFESAAELATFLRKFAARVEREWAECVKERAP